MMPPGEGGFKRSITKRCGVYIGVWVDLSPPRSEGGRFGAYGTSTGGRRFRLSGDAHGPLRGVSGVGR